VIDLERSAPADLDRRAECLGKRLVERADRPGCDRVVAPLGLAADEDDDPAGQLSPPRSSGPGSGSRTRCMGRSSG
jgi:hypothetical protein